MMYNIRINLLIYCCIENEKKEDYVIAILSKIFKTVLTKREMPPPEFPYS